METVSKAQWLVSRKEFLAREKEFTKARDALSAARRDLPRYEIEKNYEFDTSSGKKSLIELFGKNSQLVVYHFMFGPDWKEGCPSCSFWADNFNGVDQHLSSRDITFLAVSRAPLNNLIDYQKRLGWDFEWVSSLESDFNFDFSVSFDKDSSDEVTYNYRKTTFPSSEAPGISVFQKEGGKVFHTYSTYSRGLDMMNAAYHYIDLTPKGRDELGLSYAQAWVRRNDSYGEK